MQKLTVEEYDKASILSHFNMTYEQMQMMAILSGDIIAPHKIRTKFADFFGVKNRFENLHKFVMELPYPYTDEVLHDIAVRLVGKGEHPKLIEAFKHSIASYKSNQCAEIKIDPAFLFAIRDDFMSFAEELLLNENPIFITPVFLDLDSNDMANFNSLVLPWIQKTAGIVLKNLKDQSPRKIVLLEKNNDKFRFNEIPLEIIYPEFDIPELEVLLNGDMSTYEKEKMLYWIIGFELNDFEWPALPEAYFVDCLILICLIKHNSLTTLEARCILKTLVDTRNQSELNENYSLDFPVKINSRALRCTFLYQKSYFILHSCLACLGMKNYCPEITFDGVYFQKVNHQMILNLF